MTTKRSRAMLAMAALGWAGCADTEGAVSVDSAAVEFGPAETIHGSDFTRFRMTGGRVALKGVDLESTSIEAVVERGGGFETHPGAGNADGRFQIEGVPRGATYWLHVGTSYYLTRERFVDVGVDAIGRPDAIGAEPGTNLVVDADGLLPVTAGDDLQIEAPDAQIGFYSTASALNPIIANAPAVGDTALAGAVFPFFADATLGTTQFPLIQASRGDSFTLAQLTTLQLGSITYQSLARALTVPVEMTQGEETVVRGTLTAPPRSIAQIDFRQAEFEALAEGVHAGAIASGTQTVLLDASPAGQRVNTGTPDLAIAPVPAGSGARFLPLEYRNPYPASWPLFGFASVSFQVPYVGVADDGTPVTRTTTSSTLIWEFVHRGAVTLAPVLSSVRDLSVDGVPAGDEIQATTATPIISWKRPRHGDPAAYVVRVIRVLPESPFLQRGIARLVVRPDVHRVRVPAGVLQPGEHYLFQLVAVASSEPRGRGELEILFVPPHTQVIDAFSGTIHVE